MLRIINQNIPEVSTSASEVQSFILPEPTAHTVEPTVGTGNVMQYEMNTRNYTIKSFKKNKNTHNKYLGPVSMEVTAMDISHSVSTDGSDTSSSATRPVCVDEIPGPANHTSCPVSEGDSRYSWRN